MKRKLYVFRIVGSTFSTELMNDLEICTIDLKRSLKHDSWIEVEICISVIIDFFSDLFSILRRVETRVEVWIQDRKYMANIRSRRMAKCKGVEVTSLLKVALVEGQFYRYIKKQKDSFLIK